VRTLLASRDTSTPRSHPDRPGTSRVEVVRHRQAHAVRAAPEASRELRAPGDRPSAQRRARSPAGPPPRRSGPQPATDRAQPATPEALDLREPGASQRPELGVEREVAVLVRPGREVAARFLVRDPCCPMCAAMRSKTMPFTRGSSLTAASCAETTPDRARLQPAGALLLWPPVSYETEVDDIDALRRIAGPGRARVEAKYGGRKPRPVQRLRLGHAQRQALRAAMGPRRRVGFPGHLRSTRVSAGQRGHRVIARATTSFRSP
jgi:hypothetical protein